jgi:hypothetical protein
LSLLAVALFFFCFALGVVLMLCGNIFNACKAWFFRRWATAL